MFLFQSQLWLLSRGRRLFSPQKAANRQWWDLEIAIVIDFCWGRGSGALELLAGLWRQNRDRSERSSFESDDSLLSKQHLLLSWWSRTTTYYFLFYFLFSFYLLNKRSHRQLSKKWCWAIGKHRDVLKLFWTICV